MKSALLSLTGCAVLAACGPASAVDGEVFLTRFVEGCAETAPYFETGRSYFEQIAENPDATGEYLSEYVLPSTTKMTAYFVDIELGGDHHLQCIMDAKVEDRVTDDFFATVALGVAARVPKGAITNLGCDATSDACEWHWRRGNDAQMMRVARNRSDEDPAYFYAHFYTTIGLHKEPAS